MGPKKERQVSLATVATIISILTGAGSIVWGASKIDSRVESIEKWIVANADTQIKLVQASEQSKVLEENQHKIMNHLDSIDERLLRGK